MKLIHSIFPKLIACSFLFFLFTNAESQNIRKVGNVIYEDVPEIPQEVKDRLQQYQNTRSASFVDWMPNDEGILIATRFGNTTQLHTVKSPGAARNQITFFDEPVSNAGFCPSPDYNGFLFTKDMGGNEFSQIFWYDMNKRDVKMISDGESVNFGVVWSNSGDKFTFTSTRRNKVDFDIYIAEMSSPKEATMLIDQGSGYWMANEWSPDDQKFIVAQSLSSTKSNAYIYDLVKNELVQINDEEDESIFYPLAWNKAGDKIYVITNKDKEFNTLALFDVDTGELDFITDKMNWNVDGFDMNEAKTQVAFTVNDNGFNQLYLMDTETNTYEKIPNLPIGQISSIRFHPSKDKLAINLNTAETPGDVYVLDLETYEKERWTYSEVGGLNTSNFPKPELISYETFDEVDGAKRQIPAFIYKPAGVKEPLPVMISIHGGPEGQHTPRFSSFYAYLANELGIAIIAPNVRGSDGYGKTYLMLDNGFNRENSVKDIGKLIEWIESHPEFDKDKIAVYGGSYGGYMVLSSMFNYNDKIKCGIDIVGISNFVTFLENTQEYRRDLRRVEYGDERIPEMNEYLTSISPTTNVNKITKPLFVIQGANDPRVPASEAEQIVKAVRDNDGAVWYMLALDEGHGFRKKVNRDMMMEAIALFLKTYLLDK